jgi:hypothetical protein
MSLIYLASGIHLNPERVEFMQFRPGLVRPESAKSNTEAVPGMHIIICLWGALSPIILFVAYGEDEEAREKSYEILRRLEAAGLINQQDTSAYWQRLQDLHEGVETISEDDPEPQPVTTEVQ